MPHDIFLSHSVKDKALADSICERLERSGFRCWVAPRDIIPGMSWGEAIIDAISTARVMVLIFSSHANSSQQIIREVERAVHRGVVIVPFRVEDVPPSKALEYYISAPHWLDAITRPMEPHLQRLEHTLRHLLGRETAQAAPSADADDSSARPPAIAGRYAVEEELGSDGAFTGVVARDADAGRRVAVWVMDPGIAAKVDAERFLAEMAPLRDLRHPGILAPLECGVWQGRPFCAYPHPGGVPLREHLRGEGRLPPDEARGIAANVADALRHAHGEGMAHGALTPDAILVSDGRARVCRFGVAHALQRAARGSGVAPPGDPAYQSPEQLAGEPDEQERGDLYALGCLLFEMLAGEPPFDGPTPQAVIARRFLHPVPSLRGAVPDELEAVVARALARTPDERFATAADFALALAPPRAPASVTVEPHGETVECGDSRRLTATVRSAAGERLPGHAARWSTSDPAVATVDAGTGVARAVASGTAVITAAVGALHGSAPLTVAPARVARVQIHAPATRVEAGERLRLSASLADTRGAPLVRDVAWASSDASVAAVDPDGVVHARAPGSVSVSADADGSRGSVQLTVCAPAVKAVRVDAPALLHAGDRASATATPLDARGQALSGRAVRWTSSDRAVVLVSAAGELTARAPGAASLVAACEGVESGVEVRVAPQPVASVHVTRGPGTLRVGRAARVQAVPRDADGRVLHEDPVWSSRHPEIASVTPDGRVKALAPGLATLVARVRGTEGEFEVVVFPRPQRRRRLHLPPITHFLPRMRAGGRRAALAGAAMAVAVLGATTAALQSTDGRPLAAAPEKEPASLVLPDRVRTRDGAEPRESGPPPSARDGRGARDASAGEPQVRLAGSEAGAAPPLRSVPAAGLADSVAVNPSSRGAPPPAQAFDTAAEARSTPPAPTPPPDDGAEERARAAIRAIIERQRQATERVSLDAALADVSAALARQYRPHFAQLRELRDVRSVITGVEIDVTGAAHAEARFHARVTGTRKSTGAPVTVADGPVRWRLTLTGERWIITAIP